MKESTLLRPLGMSTATMEHVGRSGRRAIGDISAKTGANAPVKSFQSTLAKSKTVSAPSMESQKGTPEMVVPASNASILAAIGAMPLAARQNSAVDGVGRNPVTPPRGNVTNNPTPDASTPTLQFNSMQQNWLDANTGAFANVMKHNLGRAQPFQLEGVDVRWANGSTGKPEFSQRAVGNLSTASGKELAALMGGTLVQSPFDTFGTTQRDQYIRMPNGQMVEASVLANQLNAARTASDPFSATQSVLEIYRIENQNFDLNSSTNAVDLVTKGTLRTGVPLNQVS
jgi:hypothetical protein